MLPVIQIGPVAIQFPGLILLTGLWFGLEVIDRHNFTGKKIVTLVTIGMIAGIIGARLVYAAQNPKVFEGEPFGLLTLSSQLMSLPGGIVAAVIAGVAYAQREKLSAWVALDAVSVFLAVMLVSIHFANFASGDSYGTPSNLPWAVTLWGAQRHPVQLYEGLAAILILLLVWPGTKTGWSQWLLLRPGARLWVYIALTSLSRLFLEFFRMEKLTFSNGFSLIQCAAWILLALSLWNLNRLYPLPQLASEAKSDAP